MSVIPRGLVLAPMAGGPGTVDLVAAVTGAGGFGFLAGAYLSTERLGGDIRALREAVGGAPFGVNLFAPTTEEAARIEDAADYARTLQPLAHKAGVHLGEPTYDDDDFDAKIALLLQERPAVVSFSFAWPPAEVVDELHRAGIEVWMTINDAAEVAWGHELGVDGFVAQGWEAGAHRGGPVDSGVEQPSTRRLLHAVIQVSDKPVIAAGGVADASHVRALVDAGAYAVACGTAFLRADEAGTSEIHRHELVRRDDTVVTRAFTGRSGRALATSWTATFTDRAPAAYPMVHHVTAPLRAHGKATGQPELVHLWAGTGHRSASAAPAAAIVADLTAEL